MNKTKQEILKAFQEIPSVGKAVAEDLWNLGFRANSDMKNKDPEELFNQLKAIQGPNVCRCMLYTFRLVVYYVSTDSPDPKLLQWWKWKD